MLAESFSVPTNFGFVCPFVVAVVFVARLAFFFGWLFGRRMRLVSIVTEKASTASQDEMERCSEKGNNSARHPHGRPPPMYPRSRFQPVPT